MGGQKFKALVDTGNSTTEAIAISEELHKKIGSKFKKVELEETRTAKKGASLLKLGISEPLKLKIIGIPKKTWTVQPAVYRELTDTVNIGVKFLEKIGAALKFKKGNTLIIGDDHTPMIKSMKSLLEQPALKGTDDKENLDNNDERNLDNNDDEDLEDNTRKPGTKHWLVYAKACRAVPPTTTRMVEVEIKGFPGDPEQLNNREVLFEKRKQGEDPVAIYVWKPQGMKIAVTNHEQDAKFVGAGQLLGKISLLSTLPAEMKTSNGQPEGVANPEGKPQDGLKYHGLKEMSSAQRASDFSERLDAIFEELEVDNNRI